MSEKETRQTVVKALRRLDAHSVENRVGIGTPDLTYAFGWIELKCLDKWPVRPATPVALPHDFTKEQRIWARRRWAAGGEVYLLLQAEHEYLLFDGPMAADLIGKATKAELRASALLIWGRKAVEQDLAGFLWARAKSRMALSPNAWVTE